MNRSGGIVRAEEVRRPALSDACVNYPADVERPVLERMEEAERHCGVEIKGLNARIDADGDVLLLGELVPREGLEFTSDIIVTAMAYDGDGRFTMVKTQQVKASHAFALEPISLWLFCKGAPDRVRIFPRRA